MGRLGIDGDWCPLCTSLGPGRRSHRAFESGAGVVKLQEPCKGTLEDLCDLLLGSSFDLVLSFWSLPL